MGDRHRRMGLKRDDACGGELWLGLILKWRSVIGWLVECCKGEVWWIGVCAEFLSPEKSKCCRLDSMQAHRVMRGRCCCGLERSRKPLMQRGFFSVEEMGLKGKIWGFLFVWEGGVDLAGEGYRLRARFIVGLMGFIKGKAGRPNNEQ